MVARGLFSGVGIQWLAAVLFMATVPCFGTLHAETLSVQRISASASENTTTVRIECGSRIVSFQRADVVGRVVVVRIPDAILLAGAIDSSLSTEGVRLTHERIRTILVLRFALAFAPDSAIVKRSGPNALALTISGGHSGSGNPTTSQPSAKSQKWLLDVIVLDAGHGGIDAGAIGVNKVSEKTVTLAIATKVKALIAQQMPQTKVVMTRETDTFVELFKRTQIANEAKGKLFVSIHCNSMPTKPHPAHGCETYILRPGRNANAARVAARENASIQYEKSSERYNIMDEEHLIVATMAQRSFVRFSEELARAIQKSVHEGTRLADRGVSQAGFFVLVGASMPNILFETAFLSNTDDAAYISSQHGQQETAEAIVKAITAYAEVYQRSATR